MNRKGTVFADRYHARILKTPTEVRRVREYLLNNARKHYGLSTPDRFASTIAVTAPEGYLLKRMR